MIEKYKKIPKGIKASLWFMICNILQKGIAFITIPIFTRLLTTNEYGMYSLFLSWQEIISIFATLNLNYQVFNNGMVKYKKDKDGYASSMVGLAFLSSITTFLLITLFYKVWYKYTGIDFSLVCLMFLNMFSLVVIGLWTVRNRYEYNYRDLTIFTIIMSIMNPILGIIFVKFGTEKVFLRVLSITLTSVVFGIIAFVFLIRKSRKLFNKDYIKYALKLDLPLIPHYVSMVLLHSSDRIIIGKLVSKSATAFYSISYNVAVVMQIIINSVNASFIPWTYHHIEKKEYSKIKTNSNYLLLLVAIISIIPMFFAPEAIMILGGKEYMDAATIVPILSTSVFMMFLYSLFINVEMFYEKSGYITIGTLSAALLNIILNLIFIRIYGYKAAAFTTLISYILLAIFHYIMYRKTLKDNKVADNIYDIKTMVALTILLIVISISVTFIYKYILIRYAIALLILILIIIKKRKIIEILNQFKKNKK